ncbi:MAG: MMPL family transporter [Chloroflexi bacterium]|nr:MMPL family transporter [Chloroflexota bacterium]
MKGSNVPVQRSTSIGGASLLDRILSRVTTFSISHPRLVIALTIVVTISFAVPFPKAVIDTDPKHMLPETSPVRQYNDSVERDFALHADVIALGIVNERGIVNRDTLSRVAALTGEIQKMPGVVSRDVTSLSTIDNVTAQKGELLVGPPLDRVPESAADLQAFHDTVLANPLFINRIISRDGTATAIYVPIDPKANGKEIADKIRDLLGKPSGGDRYYLAGDPVARDTFGAEMFRQMGLFSPIAGLVMCIALWLLFRSIPLIVANMAVAMVSIVWCMGLLIGLRFPVHIMSSMSPVFLMAIATDSVHIFNEFAFRFGELRDKRKAVLDTIAAVGKPVFYSDVTTAIGFASLATASIIPVRVFGLFVAFGTFVILLMSFTLVPAILVLVREDRIPVMTRSRNQDDSTARSWLSRLGQFCVGSAKPIAVVGGLLLAVAVAGLFRIQVNNNLVHWFKQDSEIRTADRVLNARLGGTSTGYLVIQSPAEGAIKDPAMLRNIEGLQRELEKDPRVGKTFSVVDYVKRINRVLHDDAPGFDRVPDSAEEVGQYLFLFGTSAKPSDLDNVVDYPFQRANLTLQLKSWDAGVMRDVIRRMESYLAAHPLPVGAIVKPAGIAYFNLVWNDEVLWGMLDSFLVGLVLVLLVLVLQLRSVLWGILAFLPLLFTIVVIYGAVGFLGKDFDMPVAVLSTLSLGLAVDFAIHFVGRFRQRLREQPGIREALVWTVARPGRGIFLNAVLFALGFAVMIFADLTPYITVGVFMAAIMLLSAVMSIMCLPGLVRLFERVLLKGSIQ